MTAEQWLYGLLDQQTLTDEEVTALRKLRDTIQQQLNVLNGSPRFYYAGSYGKRTMIHARYDLDIVIYWPSTATYTIKEIYDAVGGLLQNHWKVVRPKTVSWELPFEGGFHVDVVPGRALDVQYYEANLHRTDTGTTLKTSLKKHIDTVRGSGRIDVIRLLKLWRQNKAVPFKKSFLLEMLTIEACKGLSSDKLGGQVWTTLLYIRDNILGCDVLDPANSNNSLSDDLTTADRTRIRDAAIRALQSQTWEQVFC